LPILIKNDCTAEVVLIFIHNDSIDIFTGVGSDSGDHVDDDDYYYYYYVHDVRA
jgi:hypothetical protein